MSVGAAQPAQGSEPAGGTPAPTGPAQQTPGTGAGQGSSEYSLAAEFLQQVPEAQRPLIEPHIKKWDAGVTKRFQELHSQYQPYKEIGADPEQLQQAWALAQALEQRPEEIYQVLKDYYENGEGAQQQGLQPQPPGAQEEEVYSQLPPEIVQRLDRNDRMLEQMAQYILNSRQKESEAAEDAELDETFSSLRESHGDFDEDWVLVKISQGMDPAQAVQSWQSMIQQQINAASGAGEGLPPILGGGGSLPAETLNIKDMPRNKVKELVAGLVSSVNQGGE